MIKFICKKCGKVWYTANTSPDQKCDECGGLLEKSDESDEYKKSQDINKKY